jgi:hypothetical protein
MNREKFNGRWEGTFKYGKGYPDNIRGTKRAFSMELIFDDDRFQGTCEDVYTREFFNKPALVTGECKGGYIKFNKHYPGLMCADENMQTIVVPDQPSFDIIYTGYFSKSIFSRALSFRGEWSITQTFVSEQGPFEFTVYGTWVMKKAD